MIPNTKIAKLWSFTKVHFISTFVVNIIVFSMLVLIDHPGLLHMSFLYVSKVFLAIYLGITITVYPFSLIFYGLPEWCKKIMPIWLYGLLGAGFATPAIIFLLAESRETILNLIVFCCIFLLSGFTAGVVFGWIRRKQLLRALLAGGGRAPNCARHKR